MEINGEDYDHGKQVVHLSFIYVGHTHEDVDAALSKISEKLRTTDAETLDDLIALLPKPEEILHMFDVKNWLAPQIADIEKHSEPLHFKFVKKNEEVQVYFKGQNIDPWCELNGNILTSIPNGQPTTIKPDYSHINIERQSKQIECLHSLFRKQGTISKWERFFNVLQTTGRISVANQPWFLDCLPRQSQNVNFEDVIPPEVRELILKETKVPKFRIRKRQSKNKEARQTTKKTNKANQRPKQHKSQMILRSMFGS
ncbi:uncharacterized protein LOC128546019 [Mercenaria mercenaria]|uniref:uncharacterized protein LOC128546019 n=1 Tax=Mercenaria mercenaria TaxID=6596 RepID=UPI00234E4B42|nr:uncharacterized protein LOC128546019 [Mercenaria mercenaria]